MSGIMQHPSHELIERLAAEYVLGTLRGPARQRFERWVSSDNVAAQATRKWEERLVHLADNVLPVTPSAQVWREIERRTRPAVSPAPRRLVSHWRPLALAASLLLAVVSLWIFNSMEPATQWQLTAQLRDATQRQDLWKIEFAAAERSLRATADSPYALPPGTVHELWALPADGSAPVSLGLLPQSGQKSLRLNAVQAAALLAAGQLAVSREPTGGSQSGAPSGPVLNVAKRLPIA